MGSDAREYYEKYRPMVLRRCRKMLGNGEDAVDAAQDVFVNFLRGEEKLRGRFPSSLLYTIATNICLNRIRWKRRHAETAHEDPDNTIAVERGYDLVEAKMIMDMLFENESEQTRTICYMYHADGMTLQEIGAAVGMSFSGVRKRLRSFASRARLRYEGGTGGTHE
ncbi:MAG: sigma-70 family RNA polymerase sigma factor [Spirochaetales bacterium]|nr:sigma-70 family RNA polymerase sigma factor [Spirochaetales bacterium]